MPAAAGDIFLVTAFGTAFGQRIMLTHHYRLNAVNVGVTEQTARDSLLDAVRGGVGGGDVLEGPYLDLMPTDYTLDFWQAQMLAPFRLAFNTFTRGVPGAHMDSTETANQAAAITLRTDFAGRKFVSTKHIGPIPQSAAVQANGLLAAAYLTKLDTLGNSMLSDVVDLAIGATWNPIIWHGPLAADYTKVTTMQSQTTIRVMRRRTVRVGE